MIGGAPIAKVRIRVEQDIVVARRQARVLSELLGFDATAQVRIATAVSELARNAYTYAGGGELTALLRPEPPALCFAVSDDGPGIADLETILAGVYRSRTGLGMGLVGVRRLMDEFEVATAPGSTEVRIAKELPVGTSAGAAEVERLREAVAARPQAATIDEIRRQNGDLLRALDELEARQQELRQVNRELDETNRGVVALYGELDERATHLARANTVQERLLSYLSHEFRTPLNSTIALTGFLLEGADGDLGEEQRRQVGYIRRAAEELTLLVDDMLDLARSEAGMLVAHPAPCDVPELLATLRGIMRPLAATGAVSFAIDDGTGLPPLVTDGPKLAQILRNLVGNALKFTTHGEVRLATACEGDDVVFVVSDTGIGIAPEDQARVFERYERVERTAGPKGTGLGLPLSRQLAALLGGTLTLESEPGVGTIVTLRLPCAPVAEAAPPPGTTVLVIDDDPHWQGRAAEALPRAVVVGASGAVDGLAAVRAARPDVVLLDLGLGPHDGADVLHAIEADEETSGIPVVIWTSRRLEWADRQELGHAAAILDKSGLSAAQVAAALAAAVRKEPSDAPG